MRETTALIYSPKGPSTKDVRQMGGGGFEISDIPGRGDRRGWFVKVRTSENLKLGIIIDRDSNMRAFLICIQYALSSRARLA